MSTSRRRFLAGALLTAACTAAPTDAPTHQAKTRPERPRPTPDPAPETPMTPPVQPLSEDALAEATASLHAFATDFHRRTAPADANAITSPMSVALALAMVHAGARGETADEIANALRLPTAPGEVTRIAASLLQRFATEGEGYALSVVDRLYGSEAVPFEPAYLSAMERDLRAPLETMDFVSASEPSRARINDWVAEQTHDRIRDLLPPGSITPATKLVLTNAVYFKASWMEPFNEGLTTTAPFRAPSGKVDAKMMQRTDFVRFAADADTQLVELPYGEGDYAMTIALPNARDGLAALTKGLDETKWTQWIDAMTHERVALSVPKFKIQMPEPMRLRKLCEAMGMARMFDYTRADFTAMAPAAEQIEIAEGFHKAFIEVDEKGTEAAAATAFTARAGSAMPTEPPKSFVCDRPFAFAIRDTKTGAILFLGQVADPTATA